MKECWHDRRTQSCRDLHEPEMQCVHLDCKAIANPWVLVPDPEMGSDSGSLLRRSVQLLPCVWVEWTESRALPARFLRPCCDVVLSVWNVLVSVSTFFKTYSGVFPVPVRPVLVHTSSVGTQTQQLAARLFGLQFRTVHAPSHARFVLV